MEKVIADHDQIHMDLTGHNLRNDLIVQGNPEPFIEIYKRNPQDLYELVYKSEARIPWRIFSPIFITLVIRLVI